MTRQSRPYNRHREHLREGTMIAATLCCLPCICLVGSCVLLSHAFNKLLSYERPSTRRKKALFWEERERKRRTPWVLAPRLGDIETLTIGKENGEMSGLGSKVIDCSEEGSEGESESGKEESVQGEVDRRTEWQTQSGFFKLPLEIRRQIYEEAIGGYTLHIFSLETYRRMSHARCKTDSPIECPCRRQARQPGAEDEWGNVSLLSMLMSCRRIYSEGIEILYSKNTFTFDSLTPLLLHLLNIPSHRISSMRDVQWKLAMNADEWSRATPWLDCRKTVAPAKRDVSGERSGVEIPLVAEERKDASGAGCSCFRCWPQQVWTDTESHAWLRYCWLIRTVEDKKRVPKRSIGEEYVGVGSREEVRDE